MIATQEKCTFFDGIVPQWILDTKERSARLVQLFREYALPVEGPVLDIGSGAGILLPHLRKSGNGIIAEVEISIEMLRMAREQYGESASACYLRSDAHHLPFATGTFNTAHCFSVYPHFDQPGHVLDEIRRCLRPAGTLCILHLMGHVQLNELHREAGRVVEHDILPPINTLAQTVTRHGFTVIRTEERSDLYLLLATRH